MIHLERELRNKDLDLSKLKFDLKTTDVNELKLALKVRYYMINIKLYKMSQIFVHFIKIVLPYNLPPVIIIVSNVNSTCTQQHF